MERSGTGTPCVASTLERLESVVAETSKPTTTQEYRVRIRVCRLNGEFSKGDHV